jgi:UDP-N-acetyl-D-mannosaminuronic acid dehydrogenase
LIHCARKVNDYKPQWVIDKVKLAVADLLSLYPTKTVNDITVACFGLAFKADIDDLRESPSLDITKAISELNMGKVLVVEPNIDMLPQNLTNIELVDAEQALNTADILVLLVDHKEFKDLNVASKCLVDTRGIWNKGAVGS